MTEALRKKFVVVTSAMMVTLFVLFLMGSYLYMNYWNNRDILSILEIIAESGLFTENKNIDQEMIMEELTGEEPIYGIVMDQSGNIISEQVAGRNAHIGSMPKELIYRMFRAPVKTYEMGHYIFSRKNLSNGDLLIVAVDSKPGGNTILKEVSNVLLALFGIGILVAVSFYLSRFVTQPAQDALIREKRFITDASHELKTPLGAISINAQVLEIKGDNSIYIQNIISETARMSRLVENLLMLSRLEEGKKTAHERFSLTSVVQEMILTYESVAFDKKKQLASDVDPDLYINGDADEIRQLIAILLDNAIKNSVEQGEIRLSCVRKARSILIKVSNTGKGIQEEEMKHIFERFYTSEKSRNSGSFGLGLSIAKAIVDRHHGEISVQSIPDKETVFTVKFYS